MSSGTLPIQDSDSIGQSHLVLEFFSKCKCMVSASAVGRGSSKRYCFHPHALANTQQTLVTAGVVSLTDTHTHTHNHNRIHDIHDKRTLKQAQGSVRRTAQSRKHYSLSFHTLPNYGARWRQRNQVRVFLEDQSTTSAQEEKKTNTLFRH